MKSFLYKAPRLVQILEFIYLSKKLFISEISKTMKLSDSTAGYMVSQLEEIGFLQKEKSGRKRYLTLTPQGIEVAREINKLNKLLKT